jgi:threonine/homoserine/homoserine lactone efflux protein
MLALFLRHSDQYNGFWLALPVAAAGLVVWSGWEIWRARREDGDSSAGGDR